MLFASLSATRPKRARLFAIAALTAIALSGCVTQTAVPVGPTAPVLAPGTQPTHPLTENKPTFLNLSNIPSSHTPVRIGVILLFFFGSLVVLALAFALLCS